MACVTADLLQLTFLQALMRIADKYDMPAIMRPCAEFLMSKTDELNSNPSSREFGWKWIALADAVGQEHLAKALFHSQVNYYHFGVELTRHAEILSSLSPSLCQHILVAYITRHPIHITLHR